jgi:hypothetical protein
LRIYQYSYRHCNLAGHKRNNGANGSFNAYNNVIKLDNSGFTNGIKIYGINHAAGNNWNYYFNSVSIGGNGTATAARSSAFIRPVDGALFLRTTYL